MSVDQETPEEAEFYRKFEANARPFLDEALAHLRRVGRSGEEIRAFKETQDVELDFAKRIAFIQHKSNLEVTKIHEEMEEAIKSNAADVRRKLQALEISLKVFCLLLVLIICLSLAEVL